MKTGLYDWRPRDVVLVGMARLSEGEEREVDNVGRSNEEDGGGVGGVTCASFPKALCNLLKSGSFSCVGFSGPFSILLPSMTVPKLSSFCVIVVVGGEVKAEVYVVVLSEFGNVSVGVDVVRVEVDVDAVAATGLFVISGFVSPPNLFGAIFPSPLPCCCWC